ncbi:MAG: glycosyltransferase family 9 protein [Chloroflexota bacterium]
MTGRTLIHHDGALGDLLLSLPAIREIRKRSAAVHLAGRPDAAGLLRDVGCIDEAHDVGAALMSCLYGRVADERALTFLSRFDSVYVFTKGSDSSLVRHLREIIPRTVVILTIPPEGAGIHIAEFRLRQIESEGAGTNCGDWRPTRVDVSPSRREAARVVLRERGYDCRRPLIAIHPGSGGERKCWPTARFSSLVEKLAVGHEAFVLVVTGPAEGPESRQMAKEVEEKGWGVPVDGLPLPDLSAILSLADLCVGNDSGISHLASLVNGRVVSIFGPTDPLLWRPLGDSARVISAGEECSPCGAERSRLCVSRLCLERVTVDEVYDACEEMLRDVIHKAV